MISLALRDPMISFRQALRYYIAFYEAIADYRRAYVLGLFYKVIYGYGAVIERINSKFKTHFFPFNHTDETAKHIFVHIEAVYNKSLVGHTAMARAVFCPTDTKAEAKRQMSQRLEDVCLKHLVVKAERIDDRVAKDAHV
ncbi:MAG TPA: hypothetical protein VHJ19_13555 [Gammaproteobacteria bacterium]|nr:hypothetical protein [Gammaproteobacteria bacterium]